MAIRFLHPSWDMTGIDPLDLFYDDDLEDYMFPPRYRRRQRSRPSPFTDWERFLTGGGLSRFGNRSSGQPAAVENQKAENASTSEGPDTDEKNFKYHYDLSGFQPKDIKVKTIGQKLVVEAENEEHNDEDGFKSYCRRHYHRSLQLPENIKPEDVKSTLSDKGILRITAPLLALPPQQEQEMEVEVQREEKAVKDSE